MKRNTKGLKPFKPGPDPRRNVMGQPKKLQLDELLAECLDGQWNAIIMALVKKAKAGDIRACEVLLDRGFGKCRQALDIDTSLTVQSTGFDFASLPEAELNVITAIISKYSNDNENTEL